MTQMIFKLYWVSIHLTLSVPDEGFFFQKRIMHIKFDIFVVINTLLECKDSRFFILTNQNVKTPYYKIQYWIFNIKFDSENLNDEQHWFHWQNREWIQVFANLVFRMSMCMYKEM